MKLDPNLVIVISRILGHILTLYQPQHAKLSQGVDTASFGPFSLVIFDCYSTNPVVVTALLNGSN